MYRYFTQYKNILGLTGTMIYILHNGRLHTVKKDLVLHQMPQTCIKIITKKYTYISDSWLFFEYVMFQRFFVVILQI